LIPKPPENVKVNVTSGFVIYPLIGKNIAFVKRHPLPRCILAKTTKTSPSLVPLNLWRDILVPKFP
jgi:hypothetical protein